MNYSNNNTSKFKKLFIVFITVLTLSLTIGLFTLTSSAAVDYIQQGYGGVNVTLSNGSGSVKFLQYYGLIDQYYFIRSGSRGVTMYFVYSDNTEKPVYIVANNTQNFSYDFTSFDLDFKYNNSTVYSINDEPLIYDHRYDMPDGLTVDAFRINLQNPTFQLFTTRIVKNGSVVESGTAQLNKAIYNPDSFTFSFYDSGLVGDSFRVSAIQTTPTGFNGSAFPPLNINLGEVAKVVLYDKDGVELGFVNGPFIEGREYNIKEYFPDVDTFEIVISTPILVEETANGLTAALRWVGSVITNLVFPSGHLFPLLQLFVIGIAVSLLLLAFYYIRKAIWGS